MDPEDPFASMDPEAIRRGSLRTLQALFPELFAPEPDVEPQEPSGEHPSHVEGDEEPDPHPEEEGMRYVARTADA